MVKSVSKSWSVVWEEADCFQAGLRFEERAVGGEVFAARPACLARRSVSFGEEELGHGRRERARSS